MIEALLYSTETEMYPAEIERNLKLPRMTTLKALSRLEREGIVEKTVRGRMKFYKLTEKGKEYVRANLLNPDDLSKLHSDFKAVEALYKPEETAKLEGRAEPINLYSQAAHLSEELERSLPLAERVYGASGVAKLKEALKSIKKVLEKSKGA